MRMRKRSGNIIILAVLVALLVPAVMPVPVVADETSIGASKDASISEIFENGNYGDSTDLHVVDKTGGYALRSVLEFSLSGIPAGSTIDDAILHLYYYEYTLDNPSGKTVWVNRLLRTNWVEMQATWNIYKTGSSWSSAGGDYTITGRASETLPSSTGKWVTWDVTDIVDTSFGGGIPAEFLLVLGSEDQATGSDVRFYSKEASSTSLRPKLVVTYTPPSVPSVTTGSSDTVTEDGARCFGEITDTSGLPVTRRGIQYGKTETPTWDSYQTGSYGTGSYSRTLTNLEPGTTYYYRAYATSSVGTGYGAWSSFVTDTSTPVIATVAASQIATTTARLNSSLSESGGLSVTIRFGWGLTSQSGIEDYDDWLELEGTYSKGQYPHHDVDSLVADTTYYFRVEAVNDDGSDLGDELTFDTEEVEVEPSRFVGYPSDTYINLAWDKGVGTTNSEIRYSTGTYPATIDDGTEVYSGTGSSYTHTGLTAGTTYYYTLWGESGGSYTDPVYLLVTTSAGDPTTGALQPPDMPSRWLSAPNHENLAGLLFVYDAVNETADVLSIPRANFWFVLALIVAVIVAIVVYIVTNASMFMGLIGMLAAMTLGWVIGLIPFWIPLVAGITAVGMKVGHGEMRY